MLMEDAIEELAEQLYKKLVESENSELSFDQVIEVLDSKSEFGFRKVEGGGIRLLKQRHNNVIQLNDEKRRPYLKLIN